MLLRGASGAGKSDLALRLIDRGARLVADDRVDLEREEGVVIARAPAAIAGMLEVRGVGIVPMPCLAGAPVALVIDLVGRDDVERLPEESSAEVLGVAVPRLALHAFDVSTPIKIVLALRARGVRAAAKPAA